MDKKEAKEIVLKTIEGLKFNYVILEDYLIKEDNKRGQSQLYYFNEKNFLSCDLVVKIEKPEKYLLVFKFIPGDNTIKVDRNNLNLVKVNNKDDTKSYIFKYYQKTMETLSKIVKDKTQERLFYILVGEKVEFSNNDVANVKAVDSNSIYNCLKENIR